MNEKWFDECSVVAYPHEIRFLNIDGGSMSYCVDRHVSEYVGKIQAQLNTLQNENRDKNIKNMILQSKIDKARKIIDRYSRVVDYDDEVSIDVLYEIDDILKEIENVENN